MIAPQLPRHVPRTDVAVRELASFIHGSQPQERTATSRYQERMADFIERDLGFPLWSSQREIADSVDDHPATAARSAHAIGKSAVAARIVLAFLHTRDHSVVITTAPTARQVQNVLWRYINTAAAAAPSKLRGRTLQVRYEIAPDWYAIGFTGDTNGGSTIQGFHAADLLLVVDEAAGVAEAVFEEAESILTGAGARALYIGNPTSLSGTFRSAFHENSDLYNGIRISAYDTPNFTHYGITRDDMLTGLWKDKITGPMPYPALIDPVWVNRQIRRHGPQSPYVLSRIDAEFPTDSGSTLIALSWIERAQENAGVLYDPSAPWYAGIDVARFGCFDDQTDILTNEGWKRFASLHGAEQVLTLNGDTAEWGPITKLHRYRFTGELNVHDGERVNFAITDNHNLVTSRCDPAGRGQWRIKRYDELAQSFCVRRTNEWEGTPLGPMTFTSEKAMPYGGVHRRSWIFDPQDWAELLGWFVSEGNVYREKRAGGRLRVMIAQNPGRKQDALMALLTRMGIRCRVTSSGRQVEFSVRAIGEHLIEHCGVGAANKRIPEYIRNAQPAVIRAFLEGHALGDGTQKKDGSGRVYITSSSTLADDVQECLVKLGVAGKRQTKEIAGSSFVIDGRTVIRDYDTYTVGELKRPRSSDVLKRNVERQPYDGEVFCVSTPHRTIMVRRNGCAMWSGNSDETSINLRHGDEDGPQDSWNGLSTTESASRVAHYIGEHGITQDSIELRIDEIGVGGGLADLLKGNGWHVKMINVGAASSDRKKWPNFRHQMWWQLRERFRDDRIAAMEPGRYRDADGGLWDGTMDEGAQAQLSDIKFKYDESGKYTMPMIETKEAAKKRGRPSPDRAEAKAMAFCTPPRGEGRLHVGMGKAKEPGFDAGARRRRRP